MFKNYLKVALRSLNKNRAFAIINILGLALGLTITILVFLFVTDETSYDKHWDGADRMYRTGIKVNMMGQKMNGPASPSPMATALRTEFPEVETATRFQGGNIEALLANKQKKMYVSNIVLADSAFFKLFNYDFLHGNPITALRENNAIVLTESTAKKLFGDENAMGQILKYEDRQDMVVRGVVKDPIYNSHLEFNAVVSQNDVVNFWLSNNHMTYLRLNEGVNYAAFEEKMKDNFMKKVAPSVEQILKISLEDFYAQDNNFEYTLQPVQRVHLHSKTNFEIKQNGDIMYVYVFIGIAILVLIIAGINFMNLSTARSGKRAKEVGVRKVTGASKKMLVSQFLFESVLQSIIALFIALVLVELFLPGFNNVMETELTMINNFWPYTLGFALLITLGYGLFAGSYPAFFLSAFKPIDVLKGDFTKSKKGLLLRKVLVVTQFCASTILIIGMIIIFLQINFLHNKDLGFQGDQVVLVEARSMDMRDNFRNYKDLFLKNSNIHNISRSEYMPGDIPYNDVFILEGSEEQAPIWYLNVDYDFFDTMGIVLKEGRDFDPARDHDSIPKYIFNETALSSFNIQNPMETRLGKLVSRQGDVEYGQVIGVVEDFHVEGFNQSIRPMVFSITNYHPNVAFKIATHDMQETLAFIEEQWTKLEPSHPFRYEFLDAKFNALLRKQENFSTMFFYLTLLAIIISAMGLYGLASFTAEQRTKEIGVRKVLGASVAQIMKMLTTDFLKLVLIANIFAWPLSYILAKDWLANFSYQINMPLMPYLLATVMAMVIALLTISTQAYYAANSDPVDAIKYE